MRKKFIGIQFFYILEKLQICTDGEGGKGEKGEKII